MAAGHLARVAHLEADVAAGQALRRAPARLGDRVLVEVDAEAAPRRVAPEGAQEHLAAATARVEDERAGRQAQRVERAVDRWLAHRVGERQAAMGEMGGARHAPTLRPYYNAAMFVHLRPRDVPVAIA